jgi:putative SOS response-associated peptidase YedK
MCGRYARRSDKQKIAELFAIHGPVLPDFGPSWNVAPQTFQPVVRLNRDTGERELVLMRWGLVPYWMLLAKSVTRPILQFARRPMCVSQLGKRLTNSPSTFEH